MSIAPKTQLVMVRNGLGPVHIALRLPDGRFRTVHDSTLPADCYVWRAGAQARAIWSAWRRCPKCQARWNRWAAGRLALRTGR